MATSQLLSTTALLTKYQKFNGAGTSGDPYKPIHNIEDVNGNAVDVVENSLVVSTVTTRHTPFNEFFHAHTGVSSTLAVATSGAGSDTSITVVNGAVFSVGDVLQISNGVYESTFPRITAIATNVITLDRRIDYAHAIGTTIEKVDTALNKTGTLATPVEFKVVPNAGTVAHITRLLITITHSTAGDLGLFGNLSALTNGVLIRAFVGGQYTTFTNWKTSEDIKLDMFDVEFDARSGGGGVYGTSGRGSFNKIGVEIKLDGDAGDYLELYVQDDLSSLTTFALKAQGHVV